MAEARDTDAPGSDSIAQTDFLTVGLGPAVAAVHSYLAQSHSLSILFTNSVHQQHQQAIVGLATTAQSVTQVFGKRSRQRGGQDKKTQSPPEKDSVSTSSGDGNLKEEDVENVSS